MVKQQKGWGDCAATHTKPKEMTHTGIPGPPYYSWAMPQRAWNERRHTANGNTDKERPPRSGPLLEQQEQIEYHSCSDTGRDLRGWRNMLQLARKFKIFHLPPTTARQAAFRLGRLLAGVNTDIDASAIETMSTAICLASLTDGFISPRQC